MSNVCVIKLSVVMWVVNFVFFSQINAVNPVLK